MIEMSKDSLRLFASKAICPSCGCIDNIGSFRCVGCGAFHSTAHLVNREVPPAEQREVIEQIVNPMAYSIGPNQKIIEESFEQTEDVKSWDGGSTDFSFSDDGEMAPVKSFDGKIPNPEEL